MALASRFGDPTDAYVNGSQVWMRDTADITIEWRVHPVPGYEKPTDIDTFDIFPLTALGLSDQETEPDMPAPLESLWDGLEAFIAFGQEREPQPLAVICTEMLGVSPDAFGLVDHDAIGDAWEKNQGEISITNALFEQLTH